MNSQVKTMLALFVPDGFTDEWMNEQMHMGGFDQVRDVVMVTAYESGASESPYGTWLMQEVISKIH